MSVTPETKEIIRALSAEIAKLRVKVEENELRNVKMFEEMMKYIEIGNESIEKLEWIMKIRDVRHVIEKKKNIGDFYI